MLDGQVVSLNYREAHPLELGGHIFRVIGGVPQGGRFVGAVAQNERHPVFCGLSKAGVTENDQENEDVAKEHADCRKQPEC